MKIHIAHGFGLIALVSVSAMALASTEATPIANVVDVVNSAFHTPPGGNELPAAIGDKLLANEAIRTDADSAIEMNFPDGATLRLEGDSDLVLDSYVFDPSALKSAAAVDMQSGIMRYTTGEVSTDDTGVVFTTPVATVGIRGTDIVVSVGKNGATVIDVLSGKVFAKPREHTTSVEALEGQSVLIESPSQPPAVGAIGDFSTAAGAPADVPSTNNPGINGGNRSNDTQGGNDNGPGNDSGAGGGGNSGGDSGGGGSGGGGDSGGGTGGGTGGGQDGDGNSGHGDNADKHDPDNPGGKGSGGKGKGNSK